MPPKANAIVDAEQPGAGVNTVFLAKIEEAVRGILEHHVFAPLALHLVAYDDDGGPPVVRLKKKSEVGVGPTDPPTAPPTGTIFNLGDYKSALASAKQYRCNGNEFWIRPMWSIQPNIPINVKGVERMIDQSFQNPNDFVGQTLVWVEGQSFNPLLHLGQLRRISAEESWYAKILRIHGLIQEGASDQILEAWKTSIESTPLIFELHSPEQAMARHINLRDQSVQEGRVVGRTALQRVFEVVMSKKHWKN